MKIRKYFIKCNIQSIFHYFNFKPKNITLLYCIYSFMMPKVVLFIDVKIVPLVIFFKLLLLFYLLSKKPSLFYPILIFLLFF